MRFFAFVSTFAVIGMAAASAINTGSSTNMAFAKRACDCDAAWNCCINDCGSNEACCNGTCVDKFPECVNAC